MPHSHLLTPNLPARRGELERKGKLQWLRKNSLIMERTQNIMLIITTTTENNTVIFTTVFVVAVAIIIIERRKKGIKLKNSKWCTIKLLTIQPKAVISAPQQ